MIRRRMLGPIPYEVAFFDKVFCINNRVSEESHYLEYARKGFHGSREFDLKRDLLTIRQQENGSWKAQIKLREGETFSSHGGSVQESVFSLANYLYELYDAIHKVANREGGEDA